MTSAELGLLFTALAYVVGWSAYVWEVKRLGIHTLGVFWILVWGFFGGVLLAKLAEALLQGSPLLNVISPQAGGRTIIAGVLGGWLCVEVVKRRLGIKCSTGNAWALALTSGEAVGRLGCWFNGCCYGKRWEGPWAVWTHEAMRYPTQFIQSAAAVFTFALMVGLRGRIALFPVYLLLWSGARFWVEMLREPVSHPGLLSTAQVVSAYVLILSTIWLARVWRRGPIQRVVPLPRSE